MLAHAVRLELAKCMNATDTADQNREKHLSEIIIRDAQTNKVWVIHFETFDSENRYSALHLSPAASEVRNYAYNQWKRLEAKNSAH